MLEGYWKPDKGRGMKGDDVMESLSTKIGHIKVVVLTVIPFATFVFFHLVLLRLVFFFIFSL